MSTSGEKRASVAMGTLIGGRFRVESKLGSGGMADVYRAMDIATNRPMALKLLKQEISDDADAVERVRREGDVLRTFEHPAIVRVETFGQTDEGRIFLVMELLSGETLGERLRRAGALKTDELTPIVTGTCAGLTAAHERGIVHRDLKPDNIFLAQVSPTEVQVKLLDFGIAKVTGKDGLTNTGEVLGTPRYMAPEQLAAERDLDGRTDVYALGVILFEALAGTPPFLAASPTEMIVAILQGKHAPLRSYRPDVPAAIEAVVARAMARTREARYATAIELATAYVGASPARAPAAAAPDRGAATAFMGSVEPGAAAALAAAKAASSGDEAIKPGTFSELPQRGAKEGAAPEEGAKPDRRGYQPTVPALTASSPGEEPEVRSPRPSPDTPEPRASRSEDTATRSERSSVTGKPAPALARSVPAPTPSEPKREPAPRPRVVQEAVAWESGPGMSTPPARGERARQGDVSDYRLPTNTGRTKLWVVGLLAGALSAGIAIFVLSFLARRDREEEAPPTPAAAEPAEPERAEKRPARGDPAELLVRARTAFRAGENARCVELVDRALAAGAEPAANRLRGDCQLAAGEREAARGSYESYCRAAPDDPGLDEVRTVVVDLGGTCD